MMKYKVLVLFCLILLVAGLNACKTVSNTPLPRSMKGYELYSWQQQGQWRFTLITGTNRNKTMEEIISGEQTEGADGWVNLRVEGVKAIKVLLGRVLPGEFVTWSGRQWVTMPAQQGDTNFGTPPADIINDLKDCAKKRGLEFNVTFSY